MSATVKELRHHVEVLQNRGYDISIEWALGRPRCYNRQGDSELSPRLSRPLMAVWLEGFEEGANHGYRKGELDAKRAEAEADAAPPTVYEWMTCESCKRAHQGIVGGPNLCNNCDPRTRQLISDALDEDPGDDFTCENCGHVHPLHT